MAPAAMTPEARLALYEQLVARVPGLERRGKAMPYTSRNGHMFSFLMQDGGLALRLPDEAREAFVAKYRTGPCVQHGAVMKEYVVVPDALLRTIDTLAPYFIASHAYLGTMAPKPTTAKKKAAKKKAAKTPTRR